ncbi:UNVERIFIED_CONTAM: hypothetical protein FKN15_017964 [Acipenser sinensis]
MGIPLYTVSQKSANSSNSTDGNGQDKADPHVPRGPEQVPPDLPCEELNSPNNSTYCAYKDGAFLDEAASKKQVPRQLWRAAAPGAFGQNHCGHRFLASWLRSLYVACPQLWFSRGREGDAMEENAAKPPGPRLRNTIRMLKKEGTPEMSRKDFANQVLRRMKCPQRAKSYAGDAGVGSSEEDSSDEDDSSDGVDGAESMEVSGKKGAEDKGGEKMTAEKLTKVPLDASGKKQTVCGEEDCRAEIIVSVIDCIREGERDKADPHVPMGPEQVPPDLPCGELNSPNNSTYCEYKDGAFLDEAAEALPATSEAEPQETVAGGGSIGTLTVVEAVVAEQEDAEEMDSSTDGTVIPDTVE